MKDCIFCKIIRGDLPSYTIYEDETIKVIMNINPITDGHLLVLPKEHYVDMRDLNEDIVLYCYKVIKDTIYPQLKEKLNCEGLTLAQNNELGQEIKHYHIHLIPRYKNDNAEFQSNKEQIHEVEDVYNKLK